MRRRDDWTKPGGREEKLAGKYPQKKRQEVEVLMSMMLMRVARREITDEYMCLEEGRDCECMWRYVYMETGTKLRGIYSFIEEYKRREGARSQEQR